MADKQDYEVDGRLLSQLRVIDLKQELEKRGLSKSGTKKELTDRLKVQLQMERMQQQAAQDEDHVPNLALQDDAIGEQNELVKEYLTKQQEIYEIHKEARRRVEMEEEEMKKQSNEGGEQAGNVEDTASEVSKSTDKWSDETGAESSEAGKPISKKTDVKEEMESKDTVEESDDVGTESSVKKNLDETVVSSVKENLEGKEEEEEEEEQGGGGEEEGKEKKNGEKVSEVDANDEVEKPVEASKEESEKDGNVDENYTEQTKTPRNLRPRLRRDVFHAETETKKGKKGKESESTVAQKPMAIPATKQTDDDSVRSRMRTRQKLRRDASSCSSSSSRSQSPAIVKKSQESPSSSSRDDSPSESASSTGTSDLKTSRFKGGEKSQTSATEIAPEAEYERRDDEDEDEEQSESPSASDVMQTRKRRRLKRSQTPEISENPEDVIMTQPEDEEIVVKADEIETSEMDKQHNVENIGDGSTDMDNKSDENNEQQNSEADKEDAAKPATRVHVRKLSISSGKESGHNKENLESPSEGEKPVRKRKWGSTSVKTEKKASIAISTDSLKNLIPDVKPLSSLLASDNVLDFNEGHTSDAEETSETGKDVRIVRTITQRKVDDENVAQQSEERRKEEKTTIKPISLTDEPIGRDRSPSPARNPMSRIIHIRNLVRPFTINQLKELLGRTGTLVEGGFWTDKIKSKCYATYETQEQAVNTRQALHGTQWPPSNRKNLIVDYADEDELQFHMSLTDSADQPKQMREIEQMQREPVRRVRDNLAGNTTSASGSAGTSASAATGITPKTKEQKPLAPPPPIREWDKVKIGERSPGEKERRKRAALSPSQPSRDRKRERGGREGREKKDHRKKEEEEAPAKLLDDLFKKTKTTPCIYWLPLTLDQIKQREEDRKKRQVEREKRRQQIKKEGGTSVEKEKMTAGAPGSGAMTTPLKDVKKSKDEQRSRKRSASPRSRPRKR